MTEAVSVTYAEALAEARSALKTGCIENAAFDARQLLASAAGIGMAGLIARSSQPAPALALEAFRHHIQRRARGEPVARILGEAEFRGLSFRLNDETLVPRPDTETLVEAVLREACGRAADLRICDLGTGSGAIAIALLRELPRARLVATDISEKAIEATRRNAERHSVLSRLTLIEADFALAPEGPFDIVVSNPPYVRSDAIAGLQREVRDHDPRLALDGGPDGLDAYRAILSRIRRLLAPGGFLAFEVGYDQAASVASLCRAAGLAEIDSLKDIGGHKRVVTARATASSSPCGASKKALGEVG